MAETGLAAIWACTCNPSGVNAIAAMAGNPADVIAAFALRPPQVEASPTFLNLVSLVFSKPPSDSNLIADTPAAAPKQIADALIRSMFRRSTQSGVVESSPVQSIPVQSSFIQSSSVQSSSVQSSPVQSSPAGGTPLLQSLTRPLADVSNRTRELEPSKATAAAISQRSTLFGADLSAPAGTIPDGRSKSAAGPQVTVHRDKTIAAHLDPRVVLRPEMALDALFTAKQIQQSAAPQAVTGLIAPNLAVAVAQSPAPVVIAPSLLKSGSSNRAPVKESAPAASEPQTSGGSKPIQDAYTRTTAQPQENILPNLDSAEKAPVSTQATVGQNAAPAFQQQSIMIQTEQIPAADPIAEIAFQAVLKPIEKSDSQPQEPVVKPALAPIPVPQVVQSAPPAFVPDRPAAAQKLRANAPEQSAEKQSGPIRFVASAVEASALPSLLREPANPIQPAAPEVKGDSPFRDVAETLRSSEPVPDRAQIPPAQPSAVQQIAVRIAPPAAPAVELRVIERGGEIHVSVRTHDSSLQSSLRQDLGTLSTSLDRAGYRSETFIPRDGTAQASRSGQNDFRNGRESEPGSSGRGGSGDAQQRRDDRQQRRGPASANWIEELENAK